MESVVFVFLVMFEILSLGLNVFRLFPSHVSCHFCNSFLSGCFGFRVVLVVVVCTRRSNCVRAFWVFLGCGRLFRIVLCL